MSVRNFEWFIYYCKLIVMNRMLITYFCLYNHRIHFLYVSLDFVYTFLFLSLQARSKQLCGFLGRQEGKLKTWRDRWFKLDEASGILFYYNNKTDPLHAGYAATSLM